MNKYKSAEIISNLIKDKLFLLSELNKKNSLIKELNLKIAKLEGDIYAK